MTVAFRGTRVRSPPASTAKRCGQFADPAFSRVARSGSAAFSKTRRTRELPAAPWATWATSPICSGIELPKRTTPTPTVSAPAGARAHLSGQSWDQVFPFAGDIRAGGVTLQWRTGATHERPAQPTECDGHVDNVVHCRPWHQVCGRLKVPYRFLGREPGIASADTTGQTTGRPASCRYCWPWLLADRACGPLVPVTNRTLLGDSPGLAILTSTYVLCYFARL